MTDLEATRLCAVAMGYSLLAVIPTVKSTDVRPTPPQWAYCPLQDDAQAMALVKRFMLTVDAYDGMAMFSNSIPYRTFSDELINHAIVYCVASMQKEKGSEYY